MARAIANVQRWYPGVELTQKALDHVALLIAIVSIYGTRVAAIKARKYAEKHPKPWTGANIVGLAPPNPPKAS